MTARGYGLGVDDPRRFCLILLPTALEASPFAAARRGPAPRSGRRDRRARADRTAAGAATGSPSTQARRLSKRLPAPPRVLVLLHPSGYRLARALIALHPDCELWYGPGETPFRDARLAALDALARERCALAFDPAPPAPGEVAFRANAPLWERLEALGLARR